MLTLRAAGADAQHQPAPADVVDGRDHLGQQPGVAVAGAGDERPDLDPRDRNCERGQDAEALQVR